MGDWMLRIDNWPQPPEHLCTTIFLEEGGIYRINCGYLRTGSRSALMDYLNSLRIEPLTHSVTQRGVFEFRMTALRHTMKSMPRRLTSAWITACCCKLLLGQQLKSGALLK